MLNFASSEIRNRLRIRSRIRRIWRDDARRQKVGRLRSAELDPRKVLDQHFRDTPAGQRGLNLETSFRCLRLRVLQCQRLGQLSLGLARSEDGQFMKSMR